ncbi:MAG: class I SAM-dependent methyltransferase [Arenicella sp.]
MGTNNKANDYSGVDLHAMEAAKNQNEWLMREFRPYLGEHVCEVGAGQGNLTSQLLNESISSLTSFEPSDAMHVKLKQKFNDAESFAAIHGTINPRDSSYEGAFNSMVYINVLEHIEDDRKELEEVHRCLQDNGFLLIYVPALRWLYSDFDKRIGHYRRYHKNELIELVQNVSFKIIQARYVDISGIIPWYVAMVVLKKNLNPFTVMLYDSLVFPVSKSLESVVTPPIGKNILLIAQKREFSER